MTHNDGTKLACDFAVNETRIACRAKIKEMTDGRERHEIAHFSREFVLENGDLEKKTTRTDNEIEHSDVMDLFQCTD